ncbi:MAG: hypothetical protein ABR500_09575 [Dermatophilaceae bacterium]|nr:hypothetical protein [Intrasporangiaceae bacterium]
MKRILATTSIAAFAMLGFAGTANAAPSETGKAASCFGQVHKSVNAGTAVSGINNVGEAIKLLGGGQAKNDFAKGAC